MFANLLVCATGITDFGDVRYLENVAERIYDLERAFNVREGFKRQDDTLPERMLTEPLKKGASNGQMVRNLDMMLDEYYDVRGWTREGIPSSRQLKALGLTAVINDLKKLGIEC